LVSFLFLLALVPRPFLKREKLVGEMEAGMEIEI
jgi:hypothetical protein